MQALQLNPLLGTGDGETGPQLIERGRFCVRYQHNIAMSR